MVKVKNLHGTSDRLPAGCDSWLEFWTLRKGYWPTECSVIGCHEHAEVGGHVIKVNSTDRRWYIVPLCYRCNNDHDGEFYVPEDLLVPVNTD